MAQKDCDPRCTGKCNKNRFTPITTANKGCDPRCTGRCSKKNAGISPIEILPPISAPEECPPPIIAPEGELPSGIAPEENLPPKIIPEETVTAITPPVKYEEADNSEEQNKLLHPGELKFVIMDLDGVILDIELVYQWVMEDLAGKFGIPSDEVKNIIDLQDEETARKICADYNLPITPKVFMNEFTSTSMKHLANTPLMPGIERLMDYFIANNFPVAVASTSNEEAFQHKTKRHTRLFKKCSHIVLGGSDPEVQTRKPSPQIYTVCGSRFPSKPNPKTILVLEDTPEGVEAAIGAHMNVVWFPNKYMRKENKTGALAVLDSIGAFEPQQFGLPQIK